MLVKEAKHKVLPELTDEWVDEASEFDTVDELRADIRKRLEIVQKLQAQMADARQGARSGRRPRAGARARGARRRRDATARRGSRAPAVSTRTRRSSSTSQATGQEPQAFVDEVREGAARAVLADLALRAVVAQEAIEATDDEVDAEIERLAERLEQKPEKVRRDLERRGVLETVRSDLARGKALEFLVEHATVVDEEGNVIDLTLPDEPRPDRRTDDDRRESDSRSRRRSTDERSEA